MRELLLTLHIAGAVVLMGELLFASLWLRSAMSRGGEPALLRYTLATMQWTSKSFALPAILVNLITGLGLIHFGRISMHSMWLAVSLLLYVVVTGLWHGFLIPLRKKTAAAIEAGGAGGMDAVPMAKRWVSVSGVVILLLFAILALMVWKPGV